MFSQTGIIAVRRLRGTAGAYARGNTVRAAERAISLASAFRAIHSGKLVRLAK